MSNEPKNCVVLVQTRHMKKTYHFYISTKLALMFSHDHVSWTNMIDYRIARRIEIHYWEKNTVLFTFSLTILMNMNNSADVE